MSYQDPTGQAAHRAGMAANERVMNQLRRAQEAAANAAKPTSSDRFIEVHPPSAPSGNATTDYGCIFGSILVGIVGLAVLVGLVFVVLLMVGVVNLH
jgi:hypothetical protein